MTTDTETIETQGGFIRATGTEARLCRMLAQRQQLGVRKYGTTVEDNPLTEEQWLQHALEEALDLAVYLQRLLEEKRKAPCDTNASSAKN